MFLSVKERARQIASGQFSNPDVPVPSPPTTPAKPTAKPVPGKIVTSKYSPPKEDKKSSSKAPPTPGATPKSKSSKVSKPPPSPKTPKTPSTPKFPISKPAPAPSKSSSSSAKPSSSKTSSSSKKPASAPKSPTTKTPAPKTSTSTSTSKSSKPKTSSSAPKTPSKSTPKPPSPRMGNIGGFTEDPDEENADIVELKAACLKQANGITALGGRRLAIVLKQSSSSGEWYAAMKDKSSDKYLKMWVNKSKTYPTQVEALEGYLAFVKRMKSDCSLFPMSPRKRDKSNSPERKK